MFARCLNQMGQPGTTVLAVRDRYRQPVYGTRGNAATRQRGRDNQKTRKELGTARSGDLPISQIVVHVGIG